MKTAVFAGPCSSIAIFLHAARHGQVPGGGAVAPRPALPGCSGPHAFAVFATACRLPCFASTPPCSPCLLPPPGPAGLVRRWLALAGAFVLLVALCAALNWWDEPLSPAEQAAQHWQMPGAVTRQWRPDSGGAWCAAGHCRCPPGPADSAKPPAQTAAQAAAKPLPWPKRWASPGCASPRKQRSLARAPRRCLLDDSAPGIPGSTLGPDAVLPAAPRCPSSWGMAGADGADCVARILVRRAGQQVRIGKLRACHAALANAPQFADLFPVHMEFGVPPMTCWRARAG